MCKYNPEINVVIGAADPCGSELLDLARENNLNFNLFQDLPHLADLMLSSDLAFTAGGTTCWEMCSMALPMVVIPFADNQIPNAIALAEEDFAWFPGHHQDLSEKDIAKVIDSIQADEVKKVSSWLKKKFPKNGTERAIAELLNYGI